jgi:hypothetical protein
LSSTIINLIRNAVEVSRDFVLLFTLSLSELFSMTKCSSEAIILVVSYFLSKCHETDGGSMNIDLEDLVGMMRRNQLCRSSIRRRTIVIGEFHTRVGFRMTDRARRTSGTISRSSRKTIVPTGARHTRGKERRASRMGADILISA